jgi:hypothetical protein
MSVDLSKYVGQEVEITYQNGETEVCKVIKDKIYTAFAYCVGDTHYTKDGYSWYSRNYSEIVKVTPISKPMKKYEQLEQQVKEMQAEIERLKKEKEEKEQNKLPKAFDREHALSFLKKPNCTDLSNMFYWDSTPQGASYWVKVCNDLTDRWSDYVLDEVITQIQKWVIESYIQEHGKEQQNKLPKGFNRKSALSFLKKPNCTDLSNMFYWDDTSGGEPYWGDIWDDLYKNDYVPDEVTVQIQEWVIESYRQQVVD